MAKADLNFIGFETGNFIQMTSTGGTVSVQTSTKRTGAYAMRANPTAGTGFAYVGGLGATGKTAVLNRTAETFVTVYVNYVTLPGASATVLQVLTAGFSSGVDLDITSGGDLTLVGATTSSTIATLSTGTWYRIDLRYTKNSTCGAKVDGGSEQTCTANNTDFDYLLLGCSASETWEAFYDDCVIGTTALDAGVGPCVRMAVPIGAGNYSSWIVNGGTDPYARVNEIPHDSSTTYIHNNAVQNIAHTLDMQAAATVGIVGAIYALMSCGIMAEGVSTSSLAGIRLRSGSTDSDSTAVDVGNTTYIALQKLLTTDPADAAAWTTTKFDAIECGPFTGADTSSVRCTSVTVHVCEDGVAAGGGGDAVPQVWSQYRRRRAA